MSWTVDMIINPETGATREVEVSREYYPKREYQLMVHGVEFFATCEVELDERGNAECSALSMVGVQINENGINIPADHPILFATPKDASDSFRVILERAICEEACKPENAKNLVTVYRED